MSNLTPDQQEALKACRTYLNTITPTLPLELDDSRLIFESITALCRGLGLFADVAHDLRVIRVRVFARGDTVTPVLDRTLAPASPSR